MGVTSNLEPKKVFYFFEEISKIPHGSYNTKKISDYLANFAKERGLEYVQDELNNVLIYGPASAGYENSEPVLLQGHMDMVCEKVPGCPIDMANEGIKLVVDGDWLTASQSAKSWLSGAIETSDELDIGQGSGPLNHFWNMQYR